MLAKGGIKDMLCFSFFLILCPLLFEVILYLPLCCPPCYKFEQFSDPLHIGPFELLKARMCANGSDHNR